MEVSQDKKKLVNLVEQAKGGLLTLPEFQRDFVWPRRSVESLLDPEDAEEAIRSDRADADHVHQLQSPQAQFESKTLPFTELLRWEDWKQNYVQWIFERDQEAGMEHLRGEQARWDGAVRRIRDAQVPIVTLPKVKPDDYQRVREICDVFEKLNSAGLKLTIFDLMTARLHRYGIYLHRLWEEVLRTSVTSAVRGW